jgi:hypothetical protein
MIFNEISGYFSNVITLLAALKMMVGVGCRVLHVQVVLVALSLK